MNNQDQWDFSFLQRIGGSLLENAAFILGAFLLFSRTSDLMTAFAPASFLGYSGIESIYGMASAIMVEGVLFAVKFTIGRSKTSIAWAWNIVLLAVTFGISALAQTIDSFVVRETLSQQPPELQWAVSWGVPLIPSVIVGVLMIKAVFDSIPPGALASLSEGMSRKNKTQTPTDEYRPPIQIGGVKPPRAASNGRQVPELVERSEAVPKDSPR